MDIVEAAGSLFSMMLANCCIIMRFACRVRSWALSAYTVYALKVSLHDFVARDMTFVELAMSSLRLVKAIESSFCSFLVDLLLSLQILKNLP